MFVPVCTSPYIKTYNSKPMSHVELTKVIERHVGYHYSVSQDNPHMFVYGQEIDVLFLSLSDTIYLFTDNFLLNDERGSWVEKIWLNY